MRTLSALSVLTLWLGVLAAPALASYPPGLTFPTSLVANGDFHNGLNSWTWVYSPGGTANYSNSSGAPVWQAATSPGADNFAVFDVGQTTVATQPAGNQGGGLTQMVNIPKTGQYTVTERILTQPNPADLNDPDCGTFGFQFDDLSLPARYISLGPCSSVQLTGGSYEAAFSTPFSLPAGAHSFTITVLRNALASAITPLEAVTDVAIAPVVSDQSSCAPNPAMVHQAATCSVVLTDQVGLGAPTGTVVFGSDLLDPFKPFPVLGGFSPTSCSLVKLTATSSSCSVSYTPNTPTAPGVTYPLAATYSGDSTYLPQSLEFPIAVTEPSGAPPPGPPSPGAPGAPTTARAAAVISGASESHRVWREGRNPSYASISRVKVPVGTTFSFTLDKPALVSFSFARLIAGRLVHGTCVARAARRGHTRGCVHQAPSGALGFPGHPGTNRVQFEGKLRNGTKLALGQYILTIYARTPGVGFTSQSLPFTITR